MKKKLSKLLALVLAVALIATTGAMQGITAEAAEKEPPSCIQKCEAYLGYDFKITFSDDAKSWLDTVTEVTVGGTEYEEANYSSVVFNNTKFYADSTGMYILIGEGFSGTTAECTIKADGYQDLVLELDKTNHTAAVKNSQGGSSACEHTGGSATCLQKAVCTKCGEEYGELGDHNYNDDGKCTVCSKEKTAAPSVTADNKSESTYFILRVEENDSYVEGISAILCNGETLEATDYKLGLNGTKYYLDKGNSAIYFDQMSGISFKSGDILTIQHPEYKDLRLKLNIAGSEVSVNQVEKEEEPGDQYELHVRLIGSFESAIVGQKGYDAISGASTNVTQNKNSDVSVEAALVEKDAEPAESDWKLLKDSGIRVDGQKAAVNITPEGSGMRGIYSTYDSSVTLSETPAKAGKYKISVTITDAQGRTATSNELPFIVYSGEEYLEDQLVLENCTQTADGKYMYDMEPWSIKNFDNADNTVTVPKDVKAWYGSHASGTYGKLGYAVAEGTNPTQTLVVPEGCNLTLVNMDMLSSVRIVVEKGGTLVLRDSVVQGIVEVQDGGTFSMNYDTYAGEFLNGASINGQLILKDGATLENAKIYSNTNYIANGTEARHNTNPAVVTEGSVTIKGQVFIRGDEAPTGTDPDTEKSYAGQSGLKVNGTLTIPEGSVLAVYGGGDSALTSAGGSAVILDNGTITGDGKLIAVGGQGTYDNGGNAVEGKGTISVADAYLEGGNSNFPKEGCTAGKSTTEDVTLSGNTNRNLIDGSVITSNSDPNDNKNTYWSSTAEIPNLSLYTVEKNAPGGTTPTNPDKPDPTKPDPAKPESSKPGNTHTHTGGTATCSSKAICTICGAAYGELDKTNHTGGTEVRGKKEPTETEKGYTGDTYCLGCGEKIAEGTVIPALSVEKKSWNVTYKANTKVKVNGIPSDTTGYEEGKTIVVKGKPTTASAFFDGWNTKADGSGTAYTEGDTIKITGNITLYAQWKSVHTTSAKLKYKVTGTKAVVCIGTADKAAKTIKIPKTVTHKGITYKVTSIAKKAFYGNKKITKVTIGNNVKSIGDGAFFKCAALKKVTVGTGLISIGKHVFCHAKNGCVITINSKKLKTVKTATDHGTKNMVVKVPKSKVKLYKKLFGKYSRNIKVKAK